LDALNITSMYLVDNTPLDAYILEDLTDSLTDNSDIGPDELLALLNLCKVDVDPYTVQFEELFGKIHPEFISGKSLSDIEFEFIIVSITNFTNQSSVNFCQIVISSPALTELLSSKNIKMWVGTMSTELEQDIVNLFNQPITYPIFVLITSYKNSLVVLDYIQKNYSPEDVNERLTHYIDEYHKRLLVEQQKLEEAFMIRMLMEEQDAAFNSSLQIDAAKTNATDSHITILQKRYKLLEGARNELLSSIEASGALTLDSGEDEDMISLSVRLPNGNRLDLKMKQNHTLFILFMVIASRMTSNTDVRDFLDDTSPPFDGDLDISIFSQLIS